MPRTVPVLGAGRKTRTIPPALRRALEAGYRACSDRDGQVVFFMPNGKALFDAPPRVLGSDPVAGLISGNRARGITPDWRSGARRWKSAHDIPYVRYGEPGGSETPALR